MVGIQRRIYAYSSHHRRLYAAFDHGSNRIGFNLIEQVEDLDDDTLSAVFVHHLQEIGLIPRNLDEQSFIVADDGSAHSYELTGIDGYAALWLAIAKHGNRELTYNILKVAKVDAGGYGLISVG